MRKAVSLTLLAVTLAFFTAGCSGPSYKLGRGLNNMTEIVRMGEMRRSIEQAGLWEGPDSAFGFGAIRGLNRTMVRTAYGVAEVVTFPVATPSYDAFYMNKKYPSNGDVYIGGPYRKEHFWSTDFMTADPRYPASYAPGPLADGIFATDTALGFGAGEIAPFVMGSRFHVFDF